MMETLIAFKRAGADGVLTYFAPRVAEKLTKGRKPERPSFPISGSVIPAIDRNAPMGEFAIGQGVSRFEDPRLVQGRGHYTDDVQLPGMAYGVVLRSPHGHAKILFDRHRGRQGRARRARGDHRGRLESGRARRFALA